MAFIRRVQNGRTTMRNERFLATIIGPLVVWSTSCSEPPDPNTLRSVCLTVEQDHPRIADGPFELPIEDTVKHVLEGMDLEVYEQKGPCDGQFTISLTFKPWDAVTTSGEYCFYGSEVNGEASLKVDGFRRVIQPLHGSLDFGVFELAHPSSGGREISRCYRLEDEDIYKGTWMVAVADALVNVWGDRAIIALLRGRATLDLLADQEWDGDEVLKELRAAFGSADHTIYGSLGSLFKGMISKGRLRSDDVVPALTQAHDNGELRRSAREVLDAIGE
jgi:hypothetical protein